MVSTAQSQQRDLPLATIPTLSTPSARAVFQSSTGHIWIATQDGLNVYDGYRTRIFRPNPRDSTSINDAYSRVIAEDSESLIWIGTDTGGLNRYDPSGGAFSAFTVENSGLSDNSVTAIIPRDDGRLWVGTHDGLTLLDPERHTSIVYRSDSAEARSLPNNYISALAVDSAGTLWVGTFGGGLVSFDAASESFTPADETFMNWPLAMHPNIVGLHADDQDHLWVGSWNGLFRLDLNERSVSHFAYRENDPATIPNDLVISILMDSDGNLWAGTVDGLGVRYRDAPGFLTMRADESDPQSLPGNTVVSIIEDRTGVIWIATAGGGVGAIRPRAHLEPVAGNDPHAPRDVRSILPAADGSLILGSGHGVDLLTPNGEIRHVAPGLPVTLFKESDGHTWVAGFGGAGVIDTEALVVDTLVRQDVYAFLETGTEQLWLAGSAGIVRLNSDHSWITNSTPPDSLGLDAYVYDLEQIDDRTLLLATRRGIVRFDIGTQTFSAPKHPFDDPSLAEDVQSIDRVPNGRLAFSTGNSGVVIVDPETESVSVLRTADGLPSDNVRRVLVVNGRIWVHTVSGLCRLDETESDCTGLDFNEDLRGLIGNSTVLPDGRVAVGADLGLFIFDPNEIENNERPPATVISNVSVMDDPIALPVGGSSTTSLNEPYDRNFLTIGFSALDFTNPERNRYRYRIVGLIDSWIDHGSEQSVSLSGLAPGNYRFEVLGSNNNGVWSEEPAVVSIAIRPPFWATWWFRMLVVAIVAGIVFAIYRYRMQRVLEMHRMRIRIADDLHDDIGSRVSSIALMLDYLGKQRDKADGELHKVSERARDVVDALRETVWVVDAEKDSVTDLVERMKSVSAEICGPRSRFEAPTELPDRDLSMELRRDLLLMYKEALNNAARHSGASEITTTISVDRAGLTIEVRDDGIGFDPENADSGRGLQTLRTRAERSGVVFSIANGEKSGTRIQLRVSG